MNKMGLKRFVACLAALVMIPMSVLTVSAEGQAVAANGEVALEMGSTTITVVDAKDAGPEETEADAQEETDTAEDPTEEEEPTDEADPTEEETDAPTDAEEETDETEEATDETSDATDETDETEEPTEETTEGETGYVPTLEDIELSVDKAEIAVGETAKITVVKVPADCTDDIQVTYVSSDPTIATVDGNGVVKALKAGTVTITCTAKVIVTTVTAFSGNCYTVLILDTSGSMSGEPFQAQRDAAIKFCTDMQNTQNGVNYQIAIIDMGSSASLACGFTNDLTELTDTVNDLRLTGTTNYVAALNLADSLLSQITDNSVRNIVFCSDGLPNEGSTLYSGKYTISDSYSYGYANASYEKASELKANYHIYTLGFFHSLSTSELAFGGRLLTDLASDPADYYEVIDPADLTVAFSTMAGNLVESSVAKSITKEIEVKVNPKEGGSDTEEGSPKTGVDGVAGIVVVALFTTFAMGASRRKSH